MDDVKGENPTLGVAVVTVALLLPVDQRVCVLILSVLEWVGEKLVSQCTINERTIKRHLHHLIWI